MVGNYEIGGDDFDSGLGAKVRENAERALALIADLYQWDDLCNYTEGEQGLHFHRECAQDHHACPGSKVNKQFILERVSQLRGSKDAGNDERPEISATAGIPVPAGVSAAAAIRSVQSELRALDSSIKLEIDGILGPETHEALVAFQKKHNLVDDWEPGSRTRTLLAELSAHAT